jgi:hypothetical protein
MVITIVMYIHAYMYAYADGLNWRTDDDFEEGRAKVENNKERMISIGLC